MSFDIQTVNKLLDINDSYKAPDRMMELMMDDKKREETFRKFLEVDTDVSYDWFHEYFMEEQAQRKTKKQDFTPNSISELLTEITRQSGHDDGTRQESAAGTGGLFIKSWNYDRLHDPKNAKPGVPTFFTYYPQAYWYELEEMSDRALPFLIFNVAIRGAEGVILHIDSLSRKAVNVYWIHNEKNDSMNFSKVIQIPENKKMEISKEYDIREWVDKL